ncbi:unnamed protein product [Prunus armeniaca]
MWLGDELSNRDTGSPKRTAESSILVSLWQVLRVQTTPLRVYETPRQGRPGPDISKYPMFPSIKSKCLSAGEVHRVVLKSIRTNINHNPNPIP